MTTERPVRPGDVISFNRLAFVCGPALGLGAVLTAVAIPDLPRGVRIAICIAGIGGLVLSFAAVFVTWRVYGPDAHRRWAWIRSVAAGSGRWLNLTTGFDDSTEQLRTTLDETGTTIDVFDPTRAHDTPLRRARSAFPPAKASDSLADLDATVSPASFETVFLLMSAHETHGPDCAALFAAAGRSLAPGGRVVLVEHLRDRANILAFGPGAWHFSGRESWVRTAEDAGLRLIDERRLDPWVGGFVFERRAA